MATNFGDIIESLEEIGFYDVALPFLLVFTLIFAILQKIKIFGEHGKNFNAVVALVFAFLVVRQPAVVEVMNTFLPTVSLMALVIVTTLLLLGILLTPRMDIGFTGWLGGLGIILTLIGVAIAFIGSSGALGLSLPTWLNLSRDDVNLLIGIGLFIIFINFITSDPTDKKSFWKDLGSALENLPGQIGGKK